MDEIEKAIRFFESDIEMNPLFTCKVNPDKTIDYVALAIQALQEKAERDNPQPLTLEELKITEYKPKYIVSLDNSFKSRWSLENANFGEKFYFGACSYLRISEYNKAWVAYDHEPKDK